MIKTRHGPNYCQLYLKKRLGWFVSKNNAMNSMLIIKSNLYFILIHFRKTDNIRKLDGSYEASWATWPFRAAIDNWLTVLWTLPALKGYRDALAHSSSKIMIYDIIKWYYVVMLIMTKTGSIITEWFIW